MKEIAASPPLQMSRMNLWGALAAMVVVYLALGIFYSRTLITWDDESSFLALGQMAVTGQIALFQDDMTGQRMPVPFYVLGASQVVFGRSLWAARLVSLGLGLGALLVTVAVARRVGGDLAGVLAGLLVATQGTIVGYFATATYHSVTALILMTAVWVLLKEELPWRAAIGMTIASLLFFTRTNLFPALPFFLVWALCLARGRAERLAVALVTVIPPALFLAADPTHLKLLANVPVLRGLVEPLGYRSILEFSPVHAAGPREQIWAFVVFARRYESWTLAAGGLLAACGLLVFRGRSPAGFPRLRALAVIGGLWLWILAWHFIMLRMNFKIVPAYFPSFALLLAVVLGVVFADCLGRKDLTRITRGIIVASLVAGLVVSVVWVRHPLMPRPVPTPFGQDPIEMTDRAAAELRRLLPAGTRVFLFAQPMPIYLAGLTAYIPQLMSPGGTMAPSGADERVLRRSGAWSVANVESWLGEDVQYAIVSSGYLNGLEEPRPEAVRLIRRLLSERFEEVRVVQGALGMDYRVYHRRATGVTR
jgi:hypothetical protein